MKVKVNPRYVDSNKCKAYGDCTRYCSSLAVDRYNANLTFIRNPEIRELEVGAIILAPGFGEIPREALEKIAILNKLIKIIYFRILSKSISKC